MKLSLGTCFLLSSNVYELDKWVANMTLSQGEGSLGTDGISF